MKLKFKHQESDFSKALGIDSDRRKVLQVKIKEALYRGFFDPEMRKISQELELVCEEAKNPEELAYVAFLFADKHASMEGQMERLKDLVKSSKSETDSDKDDILAKASSMSKKLGKLAN
jgi:hypothetical protein